MAFKLNPITGKFDLVGVDITGSGSQGQVPVSNGSSADWGYIHNSIIYQQGGTASGNIYTTWDTAITAARTLADLGQLVTVYVDKSYGSPIITATNMPVDGWMLNGIKLSAFQASVLSPVTISVQNDGAKLNPDTGFLLLEGPLVLDTASTTTFCTITTGKILILALLNGVTIASKNSQPTFENTGGTFVISCISGSTIGSSGASTGQPAIKTTGGTTQIQLTGASSLQAYSLHNAGLGTTSITVADGNGSYSLTQDDATPITYSTSDVDILAHYSIRGERVLSMSVDATSLFGSGGGALTSGTNNAGFGMGSLGNVSTGSDNTALGYKAGNRNSSASGNIFLGSNAESDNGTRASVINISVGGIVKQDNVGIFGSETYYQLRYLFGQGYTTGTKRSVTIQGSDAVGTNISTGDLILSAGESTGNGTTGNVVFKTASPGASGSSANSLAVIGQATSSGLSLGVTTADRVSLALLETKGTRAKKITTYTDTNNISATADHIVIGNKATPFTLTLPTVASCWSSAHSLSIEFVIKNIGAGDLTIDGNGSETIDGSLTATLAQYDSITLINNGSNWFII